MKVTLKQRYTFDSQTDRIGKSDFSKVYRAVDEVTKKNVALKFVLRSHLPEQYNISAEVKRALAFDHPNLVKYIEFFETQGSSIDANDMYDVGVMDFVSGGDLNAFLKTFPSEENIKHVFCGLLAGLAYLHEHHIVHRDIKPMNVMIDYDAQNKPNAKIIDFGISKDIQLNAGVSNIIGTFEYMAPEQFDAKASISSQTDIWSFGVLLYEMFTNEMPFGSRRSGDADSFIIAAILSLQTPPKLRSIPQPYQSIIEQCLHKAPNRRASISQLLKLLQSNTTPSVMSSLVSDAPTSLINTPEQIKIKTSPPPLDATILTTPLPFNNEYPPTYVEPPKPHIQTQIPISISNYSNQYTTPPIVVPQTNRDRALYTKTPLFRRFVASFIDGMISAVAYLPGVVLLIMAHPIILSKAYPTIFGDVSTESQLDADNILWATLIGLALIVIGFWYFFAKDGLGRGQSWGKRAMDLMVVNVKTNKPCTKGKSFIRALVSTGLGLIPYIGWLIEPIAVLADDDGRRLGDKVAGTMVIQTNEYY